MTHELRELFIASPRWTLAVAESLTCGRVQAAIGAHSGASDFFLGGVTAYGLDQKVKLLGVDAVEAKRRNGVSAEIAARMAIGVGELFGSDFALATTGYAEPDPTRGVAHPMAHWAIARRDGGREHRVVEAGVLERPGLARTAMQEAVTEAVLEALVRVVRAARDAKT